MSIRVSSVGSTGITRCDDCPMTGRVHRSFVGRLGPGQIFDFGVVTAGPVRAAYVPRMRIKPFIVRFTRVKVAV